MSKEHKYCCSHCHYLFIGKDDAVCPDCGSNKLIIITSYELIKDFTGEKNPKIKDKE